MSHTLIVGRNEIANPSMVSYTWRQVWSGVVDTDNVSENKFALKYHEYAGIKDKIFMDTNST